MSKDSLLPEDAAMAQVSVVIPALNEAEFLSRVFESLRAQTKSPKEIIVVDGGSSDGTPSIATQSSAMVLYGGSPAVSRNVGAAAATGDWLLFLDADVKLPPTAIEDLCTAVDVRGLDAASCWCRPDLYSIPMRLVLWFACHYFQATSSLGFPHSVGACILVRRSLHCMINGFDETIQVGEDQDYVCRLAKVGRYSFLRKPVVEISVRRFLSEGILEVSLKWLAIEAHRVGLGEVRTGWPNYFK